MDSLTPNFFVKDINQTINFYKILGFEVIMTVPEQSPFVWVMMANESVSLIFQSFESLDDELPQINRTDGGSLIFYIKMKGILDFFNKISDSVEVVKGLGKTFYGATEFSILDNNGYVLTFAEDL
ncbi:MAG: VOC family protein [Tenuifilaceae bacterium]|jgi:uncharacterized glyoxalase superfamily protein PhnB|nr:VOC family protein [Tenuifilaceae bacterium]